jgi:hypothetical protein
MFTNLGGGTALLSVSVVQHTVRVGDSMSIAFLTLRVEPDLYRHAHQRSG